MNYENVKKRLLSPEMNAFMPGLDRIEKVLTLLGNPQNSLRVVHVVGTNGKGSTSNMIAGILSEAGFKVGLFNSPYISELAEYIKLCGQEIDKESFADLSTELFDFCEENSVFLSHFEFITVVSILFFRKNKCDFCIYEAGLGGESDATNVFESSVMTVITSIGKDHTDFLGNTISEIVKAKANISRQGELIVSTDCMLEELIRADRLSCDFDVNYNSEACDCIRSFAEDRNILVCSAFLKKEGVKVGFIVSDSKTVSTDSGSFNGTAPGSETGMVRYEGIKGFETGMVGSEATKGSETGMVGSEATKGCEMGMVGSEATKGCETGMVGSEKIKGIEIRIGEDKVFTVSSPAVYQFKNALTAILASAVLVSSLRNRSEKSEGFPDDVVFYRSVCKALSAFSLKARYERVLSQPEVIIDGGHNPDCIRELAASLAAEEKQNPAIKTAMEEKQNPILRTAMEEKKNPALRTAMEGNQNPILRTAMEEKQNPAIHTATENEDRQNLQQDSSAGSSHERKRRLILVTAVMADKDYEEMYELLNPFVSEYICIDEEIPRALPAKKLAEYLSKYNKKTVCLYNSELAASYLACLIRQKKESENVRILYAGTLYASDAFRTAVKTYLAPLGGENTENLSRNESGVKVKTYPATLEKENTENLSRKESGVEAKTYLANLEKENTENLNRNESGVKSKTYSANSDGENSSIKEENGLDALYRQTVDRLTSTDFFSKHYSLPDMAKILEKYDNPQDKLRVVHVAGTNGKGSVCSFLNSIFMKAGLSTGLFTSPYIREFGERIRLNGSQIDKGMLCAIVKSIISDQEKLGFEPNQFALVTIAAFMYYHFMEADIVVLETGLGGTYDPTNIVKQPLCTVITNIGYDHMAVLGNSLEEIAGAKAGIIKAGSPLVVYPLSDPALSVIKKTAIEKGLAEDSDAVFVSEDDILYKTIPDNNDITNQNYKPDTVNKPSSASAGKNDESSKPCHETVKAHKDILACTFKNCAGAVKISGQDFCYKGRDYHIALEGDYQIRNAAVSIEAAKISLNRLYKEGVFTPKNSESLCRIPDNDLDQEVLYRTIYSGLSAASWPGRLEKLSDSPLVFVDGGHNIQCIESVVSYLDRVYSDKKKIYIASFLKDKDYEKMYETIRRSAAAVCLFPMKKVRALSKIELTNLQKNYIIKGGVFDSLSLAYSEALKLYDSASMIIFLGSLYMIDDVYRLFDRG